MSVDDAEEVKALLNRDLERVLDAFWPAWVKRGRLAYCAPASKHDRGSFMVYLAPSPKYPRGAWARSSQGIGGDELNLFAYGFSKENSHRADAEVFRAAREFVGMVERRQETPEERADRERWLDQQKQQRAEAERRAIEEERKRLAIAGVVWQESIPIRGTQAEAYFIERGVPEPPGGWWDVVRYHPRLCYDLDPRLWFGAVVARVDDVVGDLTAVWRIFLDPKKPTKAPVENAKLGLGPAGGGAVRLGGLADHIGVCEGLETAGGAGALIRYRYPVWPCLSTSGLIGFEPPMGVNHITTFPDGDKPWRKQQDDLLIAEPAGRAAARKLRERVQAIGLRADTQPEPKMHQDYLDIWNARRRMEEGA
ncbi:hypothetical protein OOZ54_12685 [Rhodopseudomonas palustris]|uniref:DUF7146 domain-containing protein n=1 Tax=Rhodopseudomonas palustris TaxID=1076 RepID=UPI0022F05078|nr:toprim domain-containing protein [Rhodopseudomonas palustris]WBU27551.1 hypothetical protein OOZ54_12685 [Rhodopseudomonas palustris]